MRRDDSTFGEALAGALGGIAIIAGLGAVFPGAITPEGSILERLAYGFGGLAIAAFGAFMIWLGMKMKDRRQRLVGAGHRGRRSLGRSRR